ncbi:hypothetical protein WJX75_005352 [Coccomyxa subellipsoidea]|uniref:PB1 domain-containing protein n=1 Tax=Coccomyxa subellipsoidea TaxID=248742 RepID=A0ABR2YMW7_9CHLO
MARFASEGRCDSAELHIDDIKASAESSTTVEVVKVALRQHDEETAEQERKSVKTIRLVGSKASSSSVKEASKRLRIEFDHAHALTPSFKQRIGAVAEATSYEWFADEDDKNQIVKPSDLAYAIQHIKNLLLLRAQEGHLVLPSKFAPPDEGNDAGGAGSGGLDQLQPDAASDPQKPSGNGGSGTTTLPGGAAMDSQSMGHRTSDRAGHTSKASYASQPPASSSLGDDDAKRQWKEQQLTM